MTNKSEKEKRALLRRWSAAFMRPFFFVFFLLGLFSMLGNYASTFEPLFTGKMVDALTAKNADVFWHLIAIIIGFQLFGLCFSLLSSWFQYLLQKRMSAYCESRLYLNLLHLPPQSRSSKNQGKILNVFLSDLSTMAGIYSNQIPSIAVSFFTMAIIGWRLFIVNMWVFFLTLLFSFIPIFLARYFGKKQASVNEIQRKQQDEYTAFINESIAGLQEINNYSARAFFRNHFKAILKRIFHYLKKSTFIGMQASATSFTANFIINMSLFIIVGISVLRGQSTIGAIVSALMYSQNFRSLVSSAAETYKSIIIAFVSAERVRDCFDARRSYGGIVCTAEPKSSEKKINISNLNFGYKDDAVIFTNFNAEFKFPSLYLLKGKNGSGKTTLLNIISGNLRKSEGIDKNISSGKISLNGFNTQLISYVSQNPFVFSATIRENICFGSSVSDAALNEVVQKTRLQNILNDLPQGIDTRLGADGHSLSQGQIQRLALARCLLHNSDIILFDEVESALDTETNSALKEILSELKTSKLVIMVTHRKDYDAAADAIVNL